MVPGYPYAWWIIPVDAFPRRIETCLVETCLVDQHVQRKNLLLVDESTLQHCQVEFPGATTVPS